MSYHLWHISSACTKPLISQTVSPWTAVPFSCLEATSLKSASCLSYLSARESFICIYFLIFPSCHFWPSDCPSAFSVRGISACWCGEGTEPLQQCSDKISLEIYQEKFLSQLLCSLLSMNQAVHFWKDEIPQRLAQRNARENYRVFNCPK